MLRRDNLVALAEKSELSKYWDEGRSNASRVKGWIYKKLGRSEMSEADKHAISHRGRAASWPRSTRRRGRTWSWWRTPGSTTW